jgi:hypothetical protein
MRTEVPAWPTHRETCLWFSCRRARAKAAREAERAVSPGRPVLSDETAARIAELRARGVRVDRDRGGSRVVARGRPQSFEAGEFHPPLQAEIILSLEVVD